MSRLFEILKKTILFGLVVVFIVSTIVFNNWSPSNLIFGPQYDGKSSSYLSPLISWMFPSTNESEEKTEKSRHRFKNQYLPKMYPKLISYLEKNKKLKVEWVSQSSENQKLEIYLGSKDEIIIETDIYTGTEVEIKTKSSKKTHLTMVDIDKNGTIDSIGFLNSTNQKYIPPNPTDEGSLYLWESSLAIVFKFSDCCK